jgi:hypothetical protein
VELVDRVEVGGDGAHHQVAVAARADQRVGAQEVVLSEVVAGGGELELVLRALRGIAPTPGGIELDEGELDEVPFAHVGSIECGACVADAGP